MELHMHYWHDFLFDSMLIFLFLHQFPKIIFTRGSLWLHILFDGVLFCFTLMILSRRQAQNPPINGAVDNITKSSSSIVSDPVFKTLFLDFIQLK